MIPIIQHIIEQLNEIHPLQPIRFLSSPPQDQADAAGKLPLSLPVQHGPERLGYLVTWTGRDHQAQGRSLLAWCLFQVSRALQFQDTREKLADMENELKNMSRISTRLNSSLELEHVLKSSLEILTELCGFETASIFMFDAKAKDLYFHTFLGKQGKIVKDIRMQLGEGIVGVCAQSGQTIFVPDVDQDERFSSNVDKKTHFKTRSILAIPLKVKDKLLGVIELLNMRPGRHMDDWLIQEAEMVSNQIAYAVDNALLYQKQKELFFQTSFALANAIESKDKYTGEHTRRVMKYSMMIVNKLAGMPAYDISDKFREDVRLAAVLHDIGKIGIKDSVLNKPGRLDEEEYQYINRHPEIGYNILKDIEPLKDVIPGILYHHERIDGTGYPKGLKGEEIPLIARIIAVADTFDAITTDRPYRPGSRFLTAVKELKDNTGKQFDGDCVTALLHALTKEGY